VAREGETGKTLDERGCRYGPFAGNAQMATDLTAAMRRHPQWNTLITVHKLALEQIALKIARVVTGDHYDQDSWKDIAGYATLGLEEVRRGSSPEETKRSVPRYEDEREYPDEELK